MITVSGWYFHQQNNQFGFLRNLNHRTHCRSNMIVPEDRVHKKNNNMIVPDDKACKN